MFIEKRVYQGSSGRVYPLPFIDRIATEPVAHSWQAVHIENEFIRLMILPEIGGRIHVGYDKTNGYDFFYRQHVIKPALVGLAGPWISGGVEFNWPQHHRPATFMPVEIEIERGQEGSVTVWCSDHDPMTRMKGMHGVCLHPGKAYIELQVRLYNRTPLVQTFLWWANVAVRVHERYQSFFPTDVGFVADHAKRAITSFPLSDRPYYGVDYAERAHSSVPAEEMPTSFVPDGSYPANDLSWYANIPVPTSYMITGTEQDFFGGYDHAAQAGVVHVANHHIAPGKKQWTWGNHEFGYAWDRSLTDSDGPYIELMAGVYTDNQPDFSFLAPWETRVFSQFWYPIRQIGAPQAANLDAAISLHPEDGKVRVGVCVTRPLQNARVVIESDGRAVQEWKQDLRIEEPFLETFLPQEDLESGRVSVHVEADGREILNYVPAETIAACAPEVATEPPQPEDVPSSDELYLTGLHLEQYRHATRAPEAYWREALRRDAGDARCNNALGLWHLRRGEFAQAEQHFRASVSRLTRRNPNPYDGEPHYNLGLTLRYQGRETEAYAAFYKATWNASWSGAAHLALGEIDARRNDWESALEHTQRAISWNMENLWARNLLAMILLKMGRVSEAAAVLRETCAMDPLEIGSSYLLNRQTPANNQQLLDLAFDLMRAGFNAEASALLRSADLSKRDGSVPMVLYTMVHALIAIGETQAGVEAHAHAMEAVPDLCFPSRLDELVVLEEAVAANPQDSRAPYYLGNLLYDRRRHEEAMVLWERSALIDATFPTVWRNLGIAHFNVKRDATLARQAFDNAFAANSSDARVLYERDQLWKRSGETPECRLRELGRFIGLSDVRDDLTVELATLLNQTGQPERALKLMLNRKFQPWEGGEGLVLSQFTRSHLLLGQLALAERDPLRARTFFQAVLDPPRNLGEAKHLLANQSEVWFWLGESNAQADCHAEAKEYWNRAARQRGDFQQMSVRSVSDMTFWSAMALRRLGEGAKAAALFELILNFSHNLEMQIPKVDYFATSLPAMLLFDDDIELRNKIDAIYLRGQAEFGLGYLVEAEMHLREVLMLDKNHAGAADLLQNASYLRMTAGLE
jgi:tetratricopeptide (TPR) repeat protein